MRKIIAFALCLVMLAGALGACSNEETVQDNGAIFSVSLSSLPTNLDPGATQYDSDTVKYIGLLFEGLTRINQKGKLEKALAVKWTSEKKDDVNKLTIEIGDSQWSDGVTVSATHFVYAWKRLLEPDYEGPVAPMLYCIKNARAVKEGTMTIDDLGLLDLNEHLIEITFEDYDYDYNDFLELTASPYLVPVREDTIQAYPGIWATSAMTDPTLITTNGPFCIKMWNKDMLRLGRNNYYYNEGKTEGNVQKYVKPYRMDILFSTSTADAKTMFDETAEKLYNATPENYLSYLGAFTADTFSSYETTTQPLLSTASLYLNIENSLLSDKNVRSALMNGIDRDAIAASIGCGVKSATGLVPEGVFNTGSGTSFRSTGGSLLSGSAASDAKSKLSGKSGKLEITVLEGKTKLKIAADAVAASWSAMGITSTVKELSYAEYVASLTTGDFDVIMLDLHAYTTDAFSILSQFSSVYNGRALEFDESYTYHFRPHVTGFEEETYTALIDEAFAADTDSARADALHRAESLLREFAPVIPLYFNTDAYVTAGLTKVSADWFGAKDFRSTVLKDYDKYTIED